MRKLTKSVKIGRIEPDLLKVTQIRRSLRESETVNC